MFDLYFTGVACDSKAGEFLLKNKGTCLLLSQLNDRAAIAKWIAKLEELKNAGTPNPIKLFIDSGAFSAWTKGKVIDIDEYISFLNKNSSYFEIFASVDVIPGKPRTSYVASPEDTRKAAEQTWETFLYMRSKLKEPDKLLWTFHCGEPIEFLKRALNYEDKHGKLKYMAFGGLVGKAKEIIDYTLKENYKIISESNNPNIKVHAFGMTRTDILEKYPVTSADSTSWLMGGIYGGILINGVSVNISDRSVLANDNLASMSPAVQESVLNVIKERGFTLQELQESNDIRSVFNLIDSYIWAVDYQYKPVIEEKEELW